MSIQGIKESRPLTRLALWHWVHNFTGTKIAHSSVCPGHSAPFDSFADQFLNRPSLALWLGPRGGGKSYLSAIETHLSSRFNPKLGTRILGGSLAQSEQIYQALKSVTLDGKGPLGSDNESVSDLLKTEARYANGSEVSILAASARSVRGPHVSSLKLDEVDEIDPDLRESAMGMAMSKNGVRSSVLMTSTWHRVGGPMAELIDKARGGEFPMHAFCAFEVLEPCPEELSGPNLEKCPQCPIVSYCHAGRDQHPSGLPKAKRSSGHYSVESLIQKAKAVSKRVFEADYLCLGPKADGVWFSQFDESSNVSEAAEFDPALPVHVSADSGVFTGTVWFQIRESRDKQKRINVFADYLSEGLSAETNARSMLAVCEQRCHGRKDRFSTDPAGKARNAIGPTVIGEYERVGLRGNGNRGVEQWPIGSVSDSLALLEALVRSATGDVNLIIHPRCQRLIDAFRSYRRAKRQGQWQDYPEDPQHPAEDLIDALRGGLKLEFPEGRKPQPNLSRVQARQVF